MKINILRHKDRDDTLLLKVEWPLDIANELQLLMSINDNVTDTSVEGPNVVSFRIVQEAQCNEREVKLDLTNIVREFLTTRQKLEETRAEYPEYLEEDGDYPDDAFPEEGYSNDTIGISREDFNAIAQETTELRQRNAALEEYHVNSTEMIKLLKRACNGLFGALCIASGVAAALLTILLYILL